MLRRRGTAIRLLRLGVRRRRGWRWSAERPGRTGTDRADCDLDDRAHPRLAALQPDALESVGWTILGAINVRAIERFVTLLDG